ncbi:MAG TPA: alpha/beta fold hydrolase [Polyangiales bacterium]|nr:alpha/beta fold hydrolase [Polyangiales bacterium]
MSGAHWLRMLALASVCCMLACSDDDEGKKEGPSAEEDAAVADAGGSDASAGEGGDEGTDNLPALPGDVALPIVFVHGFAGSAQQFQSQGMRFVANGYPAERLRAYEHNGAGSVVPEFISGLDAMVDEMRSKFGADKVFLIGHSRGTTLSGMYLGDAARAAKVAKYVALDGAGCGGIPVPCAAPAQTTNTRGVQTHPLPGQKHVEVATSKESFAVQWEFLFGKAPEVVDIVKQKAPVVISGRAVNFPANTGREGTTLEFWEVDESGKRVGSKPKSTFELGADGNWGPLTVDADKHYEQVLISKDTPNQHHFYSQPFPRSTQFVRLLSGPPDSDSRTHTNSGPNHAAIVMMRMREWTPDDKLEVSTKSPSSDQEARNVVTSEIVNNPISMFLHDDAATPGESTLALLPWFPQQPFQTGVDIFMPAKETPDGTITLVSKPRGASDKPQTLHVPNWASSRHTITVMFSDYPQE